jgi:ABC-type multidrug transport system fused ATPase/permease subunit
MQPNEKENLSDEEKLLLSHPLTLNNKKHFLQKIAKVIAMVSLVIAVLAGGYLVTIEENDKVLKASVGAIAFFCFTLGLVLKAISAANLPNLTLTNKK